MTGVAQWRELFLAHFTRLTFVNVDDVRMNNVAVIESGWERIFRVTDDPLN